MTTCTVTCTVAFTADSHWNAADSGRLDECTRVHDWMLKDWARRGVDLILHGGDMYERRSVPADRNAATSWASRAADLAPMLIVKGNHDVPRDLDVFRRLEGVHPIVIEEASSPHHFNALGVTVGAVAWPRKAELLARLPKHVGNDQAKDVGRECLRHVFRGLRAGFEDAPPGPKILLMHAMTAGSQISVGQPPTGCDFEIDLADISLAFPEVGPMAVCMGHIHKPQEWHFNGVPIIYAGSPRRTTYGEIEDKSYTLLHFGTDETGPWKLHSWERVRIPCQRMRLFYVKYEQLKLLADGPGKVPFSVFEDQAAESTLFFGPPPHVPGELTGDDIRLRYRFANEHRAAAAAAAEEMRSTWLAAGAERVTLDPEVIRTTRARTEIATAKTLQAKLMLLWEARDQIPPPARRERLLGKARVLEQELLEAGAVPPRSVALDPMRHQVKGFATLSNVDVKLHDLTGPLIAIIGENGKGKSTLLETLLATTYRGTATRRSLKWLAVPQGALNFSRATTSFCYRGQIIECRQEVSGNKARTCTSFVSVDGKTQLSSDGPTEFDAWIKQHLPPADLLYATIFAAQKDEGVIGMTAGERKGLVLRLLGHERLELLAKRCGSLGAELETALERLTARLSDLAGATTVKDAQAAVEAAEAAQAAAKTDLDVARQALDKTRAEAARAAEVFKERAGLEEQLLRVTTEQEQITREDCRIRAAIGNNQGLLDRAEEIRQAAVELAGARARSVEILSAASEARLNRNAAIRELHHHQETQSGLQRQIADLGARINRLDDELRRLPTEQDCAAAETKIAEVEQQIEAAQQARAAAEQEIKDLRAEEQRLTQAYQAGETGRIRGLRGGLGRIRDEARDIEAARREAADTLEADVATASPPDLTLQMQPALERIAELQLRDTQLRQELTRAHLVKQHGARVAAIDNERAALITQRAELAPRAEDAHKAASFASQAAQHAENAIADHDNERLKLSTQIAQLETASEHADKLEAAEARIDELQKQLPELGRKAAELTAAGKELRDKLAALPGHKTIVEQSWGVQMPPAQDRLLRAEHANSAAGEALGRARAAHERAVADAEKAKQLDAERRTVEQELADYKRLAADFGRNGIQALEIDAAGPRLTELANRLLHDCHGPRFSVEVQTQRLDSTGKREVEDFVIMVTDSEKGRMGPVETLSGGEKTIVGEALRWALTLLAADGEAVPFVARDEPAGALSAENRIAYVNMLRLAAELAGTERVLFVSHQEELSEAADSRLLVEDGAVRVV